MGVNDADAENIGEYLKALLSAVWHEGESFSGKRPFGNSGSDGTGLDDGPPLPRNVFVQSMKPLALRALKEGLSARAVAMVCQVSHETTANWAKGLGHGR